MNRSESAPTEATRRDAGLVALAALAASIAGVVNDFVYDDVPLIRDNARLHSLAHAWQIVSRPYWPPPFVEQLYRPVAVFLLAAEYTIGGGSPLAFRLVSYVLYAACCVAFFRLARSFVSRRAAMAAALLFAVHPVHVEAVALGVNQGELIIGLVACIMAVRYVTRRRQGDVGVRDWTLLAGCYAIAVLTKENGFVFPLLLLAAEVTLFTGEPVAARIRSLWRGYAALGAVAVIAMLARHAVLQGLVGASPAKALVGLNVGQRFLTMLQVVPMWLRLLAWPQRLRADYASGEIVLPASIGLPELVGIALIIAAIASVFVARRRFPAAAFGIASCIVGLLPVSNLVPTGIILAGADAVPAEHRLRSGGACNRRRRPPPDGMAAAVRRRVLIGVVAILIALGLGRSANRQSLWNSAHVVVVPRQP